MARGLSGATLGLFGGMVALEVAYATFVAKIRNAENKVQKVDSKKLIDPISSIQKESTQPSSPSFSDYNRPTEVNAEKHTVNTSSKTVYSTDVDSTSNLHISIIINTPRSASGGSTINCAKSDDECTKNFKQETDSSCTLNTAIDKKKTDFMNSEQLREILIGTSNNHDHHENMKDTSADDMLVSEEPFQLDHKTKNESCDISLPNNIINSKRLDSNASPVTLKCNKSEDIEVIPVATPPEVNKKWHANTPLLPPK